MRTCEACGKDLLGVPKGAPCPVCGLNTKNASWSLQERRRWPQRITGLTVAGAFLDGIRLRWSSYGARDLYGAADFSRPRIIMLLVLACFTLVMKPLLFDPGARPGVPESAILHLIADPIYWFDALLLAAIPLGIAVALKLFVQHVLGPIVFRRTVRSRLQSSRASFAVATIATRSFLWSATIGAAGTWGWITWRLATHSGTLRAATGRYQTEAVVCIALCIAAIIPAYLIDVWAGIQRVRQLHPPSTAPANPDQMPPTIADHAETTADTADSARG